MRIGVLDLQGNVTEHVQAMQKAMKKMKLKGSIERIREKKELKEINGLVIPGGESTTIARVLKQKKCFQK